MSEPQPVREMIGPEQAAELLRGVPLDYVRARLNKHSVTQYAELMRTRQWEDTNTDPILVAEDGGVVNGLSRLLAIIFANVSLPLWVMRGANRAELTTWRCPAHRTRLTYTPEPGDL